MKDSVKNILCLVIIIAALVLYLGCCCLPSLEEIKEKFAKKKLEKNAKTI